MRQPSKRLPQSWCEAMDMKLPQAHPFGERAGHGRNGGRKPGVSRLEPVVNPARWAEQAVAQGDCQKQADTKAFKGRGKLFELRQLLTELDRTTEAMKHLVNLTMQVQEGQMRLALHVKSDTGLTFLRWREKSGACRHVPWPQVAGRIHALAPAVRHWYEQVSEQAAILNERHKQLRRAIATARKVVLRTAPKVYARSILLTSGQ